MSMTAETIPATKLSGRLWVSRFITPADLPRAAAGFATIVNNRPDSEEPGQASSAEIARAADDAGLDYVHIPVVASAITDAQVDAFAEALAARPAPVLAFCRTGTRSTMLWALANAGAMSVDEIIATARGAGYDLEALRPRLEARAAAR